MSNEVKKWLIYLVIDILENMATSNKRHIDISNGISEAIDTLNTCVYLLEEVK